jgi:hypothetical protein
MCLKVSGAADKIAGESRSELEHPPAHCLVGNVQAPLGQEFLDIPVPEREPQVEPDGVPNDLRRELVASIGDGLHPLS